MWSSRSRYAQAEKKLPFSKAADWATTQQAAFKQRQGISCPDQKFHQLAAKIPGLQQTLDADLLRSFLLRFEGRRSVRRDAGGPKAQADGKQAAQIAGKHLKGLAGDDCQCGSIEDLRVLSDAAAEGQDEGVLAVAFGVETGGVWSELGELREALVGEGLGGGLELQRQQGQVLLRTLSWGYLGPGVGGEQFHAVDVLENGSMLFSCQDSFLAAVPADLAIESSFDL
jgi:hypothetical protein